MESVDESVVDINNPSPIALLREAYNTTVLDDVEPMQEPAETEKSVESDIMPSWRQ